jgi:D-alanyl-lipoteichoic acid acyltransferase DltB (MBOAT superfamily)
MLFPTVDFAVFFVIVFTGSWMLRPYPRPWRWFLLAASCVFYLDPFNPVATEGDRFFTANLVIIALAVLAGAATSAVLRVAFDRYEGMTAAEHAARTRGERRRSAVGAGADGGGFDDDLDDLDDRAPVAARTTGAASVPWPSIWAPLVVVGMLVLGNIWIGNAYPDRPDQSSRWLFLLIGVALANQAFAKAVFAALGPTRERTDASRWLVRIAVAVDLLVLGYFKYCNWFLGTFQFIANSLHLDLPLNIILPIAISFFTFQAISYVIDVGRGELRPIPLLDFVVYLTFFAHVVAGPIVRVKEFAPQLNAHADPRYVQSAEAFDLIFRGLFKKVVISSFVASQIVDPVFQAPTGFSKLEVLFAILGYAVQIYADFSGYTDIAIGVALLLGIRFPENFDAPYTSLSLQEFWRRWHITLSRWLRDYLYIPLGGNRDGVGRTYLNLFLTMVLGGLWHGANWTFVMWGFIHGTGLVVERYVKTRWAERSPLGLPYWLVAGLQWLLTFSIVCGAWVFFRATDFSNAWAIFDQLFTGSAPVGAVSRVTWVLVAVVLGSIASQFVPRHIPDRIVAFFSMWPPALQVLCAAVAFTLINVLGPDGIPTFIYFQF